MQQRSVVARVHQSVLAERERRLLIWLAARMPEAVTSDHLTVAGVAGALLSGLAYAASGHAAAWLWLAILGLAMNWFGDSLDGTLARHRGTERPRYGFFIDHTTDVASQVFIFIGLGLSPHMHLVTACLALMSYWLASLYTMIRALATTIFQISYWGVGPTEIRLALIGYTLALLLAGPARLQVTGDLSLIDLFCTLLFGVVFLAFLLLILTEGRRLAGLDTAARGSADSADVKPSLTITRYASGDANADHI